MAKPTDFIRNFRSPSVIPEFAGGAVAAAVPDGCEALEVFVAAVCVGESSLPPSRNASHNPMPITVRITAAPALMAPRISGFFRAGFDGVFDPDFLAGPVGKVGLVGSADIAPGCAFALPRSTFPKSIFPISKPAAGSDGGRFPSSKSSTSFTEGAAVALTFGAGRASDFGFFAAGAETTKSFLHLGHASFFPITDSFFADSLALQ